MGDVAAEVGGAAWVPFLLAFLIAAVTALSYLELVTKYPQAAGAALHAQRAFDNPFVTFLVAFVVSLVTLPVNRRLENREEAAIADTGPLSVVAG